MVETPETHIAPGCSHSFTIYEDPKILDEIPTVLTWDHGQLNQYRPLQQHYDDRRWYTRYSSTEPGHFGSDYEYQLYRLLQWHGTESKYLLLSNVPLKAIISVDRDAFEQWYARKNFKLRALEDAFKKYSFLVGNKSVDLVAVNIKTGRIAYAVEVDGRTHQEDPTQLKWDYAKSYNFRILQIPLLRISVESVLHLWRTSQLDGHQDRFKDAFNKMHSHWKRFVKNPTELTMQLHFTDPIIRRKVPRARKRNSNGFARIHLVRKILRRRDRRHRLKARRQAQE